MPLIIGSLVILAFLIGAATVLYFQNRPPRRKNQR